MISRAANSLTKCISKCCSRIHALSRINKFNRRMWAHKKWFLETRIEILWQELISCDKNWCLVQWILLIVLKIGFYNPPAGPRITLSQAKYWPRNLGSHEVKYFLPPWVSVFSYKYPGISIQVSVSRY